MRAKLPNTLIFNTLHQRFRIPLRRYSFQPCSLHNIQHLIHPQKQYPLRTLTTTPLLSKRGGKQESKRTVSLNAEKTEGLGPFDFTDYEAAISRAHEHLKSELAKIKAGGRNPEAIENVRVKLSKAGKETVPLRDVASVVPRGRNVAVLVGEKDHVKAIISALASSAENLNPTSSPTDPLTIMVPIPPTTAESRQQAKDLASKKGEEVMSTLREARGAQKKRLRAMELGKQVGPDDLRKAEKEMEKINERATGEGKKLVEGARRVLDGG